MDVEGMEVRPLHADEIQCRVDQVTQKGFSILLYKDARVDMALLDELVGPMNWKRKHERIGDKEFCTVSIRDTDTGEWVDKQDCGAESNYQKEKGETSDAFKRACTNWGIGRELYTAPRIWVQDGTRDSGQRGRNGKPIYELMDKYAKYEVAEIKTDPQSGSITRLVIVCKGRKIYEYPQDTTPAQTDTLPPPEEPPMPQDTPPVCEDCGQVIRDAEFKGKSIPFGAIITQSIHTYGAALCWDCCSKRKAARNAGAN